VEITDTQVTRLDKAAGAANAMPSTGLDVVERSLPFPPIQPGGSELVTLRLHALDVGNYELQLSARHRAGIALPYRMLPLLTPLKIEVWPQIDHRPRVIGVQPHGKIAIFVVQARHGIPSRSHKYQATLSGAIGVKLGSVQPGAETGALTTGDTSVITWEEPGLTEMTPQAFEITAASEETRNDWRELERKLTIDSN
jgi:hypothetical protein